jgi:hypothetical protein
MKTVYLFVIQFVWFLVAWATIAKLLVSPVIERFDINDKLAVWLAPQLFRVLGVGLLVQNLAPDLPQSFALPTAIGDSLTAMAALIAIIALRQRWSSARLFVLVCNIVGSVDLMIALPHAAVIKAAIYLTGQWYVPAAILPLMIVSHVMIWRTLLRQR